MNRAERRKAEKEQAASQKQLEEGRALNEEFARTKELHRTGRLADAEAGYKSLLAKVPGHPGVCFMMGMLNYQIEDKGAAEHYFRTSLASKPDQPHVLNELGGMQQEAGQFAAAETTYRQALQYKDDIADIWFNLGASQLKQNKVDEAITSFEAALKHNGKFPMGFYYLGRCFAMKGDHQTAETHYRASIELAPEDYPPTLDLANVLGHMDRWDEALEMAKRANELRPDVIEALYVLGWAQENGGQEDDAEETYRDILDRDPEHLQAKIGLARLTGEGLEELPELPSQ